MIFIWLCKPCQKAFIERFNSEFRDEELTTNLFDSIDKAKQLAKNSAPD